MKIKSKGKEIEVEIGLTINEFTIVGKPFIKNNKKTNIYADVKCSCGAILENASLRSILDGSRKHCKSCGLSMQNRELPLYVYKEDHKNGYVARIPNRKYIGYYPTVEEAMAAVMNSYKDIFTADEIPVIEYRMKRYGGYKDYFKNDLTGWVNTERIAFDPTYPRLPEMIINENIVSGAYADISVFIPELKETAADANAEVSDTTNKFIKEQ